MHRRAAFCLLPTLVFAVFGQKINAQIPVSPIVLSGTVRSSSGEPLGNATVVLQSGSGALNTTLTSSDGRFAFKEPLQGSYRLSASREGFISALLGVVSSGSCGAPVTLQAAQPKENVVIEMLPASVITGHVLGGDGRPVPGIQVHALRYAYQSNRRVLQVVTGSTTDDRGEYRLYGLSPGRYLVGAGLERITTVQDGLIHVMQIPARSAGTRLTPAYYPGADSPSAGTVIDLRPGETFAGTNIIIGTASRTIRGTLRGVPRESMQSVEIALQPDEPNIQQVKIGKPNSDGSFQFSSLLPGKYFLFVSVKGTNLISDVRSVDVISGDLDQIEIALSDGLKVSGHLQMDNPDAMARIISVALVPIGETPAVGATISSPVTNGTFKLVGIPPGEYQAVVSFRTPLDIYVKAVRLGSSDVRNGFRLDASPEESLEIVAGNSGGVLDGVALNESGQPAAGVAVVLLPEASFRKRSSAFKSATTDAAGSFRIDVIAPGEYKLLAFDSIQSGAWQDPDFPARYEDGGQTLTIREGTTQRAQVHVAHTGPTYGSCNLTNGPPR